eukprot:CAMPEP_0170640404 /NCGR_PEP_ID=MMETSP0224-20130122/40207_1 /TAXON_ID=285029 /ORGANISM="Togula jolla, Strain CCCM 725" /LENGTH=94 /DNA_ID=CAMNT_0010970909 /DNA_START=20 /DNA_END=301 /DNA_ORIENTATION=+
MRAEWFDAAAGVVAFCKMSSAGVKATTEFQHMLVRLFSMLHALALAEIEDCNSEDMNDVNAFKYELVDIEGLDTESLLAVKNSRSKVELVYQWI